MSKDICLKFDQLEMHSIELKNHQMKWLFECDEGMLPPQEHLDQIYPLNHEAANYLWNFESLIRIHKFYPEVTRYFNEVIEFENIDRNEKKLKKWLFTTGIPFKTKVCLTFRPDLGFVLTWKMVIKYCSKLFFAHDLVIFDNTLNWGLYYHHDEKFHFGKNRIYNSNIEGQKILSDAKLIADWKKKISK